MGRSSNYICPKCGKLGYLENNPVKNNRDKNYKAKTYRRVIHYNSITKTRRRCYIEKILNDKKKEQHEIKLLKEFSKMSSTEIQENYLKLSRKNPHNREEKNRMNAKCEALEYISIKRKIPLLRYKKTSADVPPEELQGESLSSKAFEKMAVKHKVLSDLCYDIAKSVYEFKPNPEIDKELAASLNRFTNIVLEAEHRLIWNPTADKRWSANMIEWINLQLLNFWYGKNAAGTMRALETGQYVIDTKDGQKILIPIKRDMTREQVGNKLPQILNYARLALLAWGPLKEMYEWEYNNWIFEGDPEQFKDVKPQRLEMDVNKPTDRLESYKS